jgi:phosphatidylinositol-3-phosphatase
MLGLIALGFSGVALADEGPTPQGVPQLNHVFLIMMENHGYGQIVNNPNAPFINSLAQKANLAQKYFAVGHPSLTNYLEVVGGSNFGVQSDNDPDWHNSACKPNVVSGLTNTDNPASPNICPIAGSGTDAATPLLDTTNETQGLPGLINIDGMHSFGPAQTVGKTIGDQLVAKNKSWKSYQESLPVICGRPHGKHFLALRTIWSAAVICPASVCAEQMSAGPDEVRRQGSLSVGRALRS